MAEWDAKEVELDADPDAGAKFNARESVSYKAAAQ